MHARDVSHDLLRSNSSEHGGATADVAPATAEVAVLPWPRAPSTARAAEHTRAEELERPPPAAGGARGSHRGALTAGVASPPWAASSASAAEHTREAEDDTPAPAAPPDRALTLAAPPGSIFFPKQRQAALDWIECPLGQLPGWHMLQSHSGPRHQHFASGGARRCSTAAGCQGADPGSAAASPCGTVPCTITFRPTGVRWTPLPSRNSKTPCSRPAPIDAHAATCSFRHLLPVAREAQCRLKKKLLQTECKPVQIRPDRPFAPDLAL